MDFNELIYRTLSTSENSILFPRTAAALLMVAMSCIDECVVNCLERQKQRKGPVDELDGPKTGVPLSGPFVLGVDEERHASDFRCDHQAAPARCKEKLTPEPASLNRMIHGQPREPEHRDFVSGEAPLDQKRCLFVGHRSRRNRIKSGDGRGTTVNNQITLFFHRRKGRAEDGGRKDECRGGRADGEDGKKFRR